MATNPFDKYIPREKFCELAGITMRCAELWAHARKGPPVRTVGRRAFYHVDEIDAWLKSLPVRSAATPRRRKVAA